jgi:hypothetical protein
MTAARIKCNVGFTKNLGDFESLRIDIGLEDSVRDGETLEEATARVYTYVSEELQTRMRQELED